MFCHLTLQGEPAPKHEPEVSLTSSQSRLSSSIPLVRRGGGGQDTFTFRNLCEAHSFCGSLHMSPREDVFFHNHVRGLDGGVRRSQAGENGGVVLAGAG